MPPACDATPPVRMGDRGTHPWNPSIFSILTKLRKSHQAFVWNVVSGSAVRHCGQCLPLRRDLLSKRGGSGACLPSSQRLVRTILSPLPLATLGKPDCRRGAGTGAVGPVLRWIIVRTLCRCTHFQPVIIGLSLECTGSTRRKISLCRYGMRRGARSSAGQSLVYSQHIAHKHRLTPHRFRWNGAGSRRQVCTCVLLHASADSVVPVRLAMV